ncbi:MAG: N-acetylneuraminate synthase family protein [Bacteroidetes bacterium]|nr:N-acetylneuraminate synthase family protein [Bacteroidota bacterium]
MREIKIKHRTIGENFPPLVIAEIGINHEGDYVKLKKMVDDAFEAKCECVKIQTHIVEDEMIPNDITPDHCTESVYDIMKRCALSAQEEIDIKNYIEGKGMIFMSTPFSRAAADRLEKLGVEIYKIGSGECNNYPLVEHIASFGKPIILSTGMNNIESIAKAVKIMEKYNVPYALTHCTSMYPTPYDKVRLGGIEDLKKNFPNAIVGLSDHSLGNYTCFAAVSLGARILEKHFTSDKTWPGPDVALSIDPIELKELVFGSNAIFQALGGSKNILKEEQPIIDFAYSCVVTIKDVKEGDVFSKENLWVKRPGSGQVLAEKYYDILGKPAKRNIQKDEQLLLTDY